MCLYNVSARWIVKTDKFILFVYCNFLVLLSTTVCSQNINKQNVNIADETPTDYSFLNRYHYTKPKNYLKRRYRIRHWIPMFIGTPCTLNKHFIQERKLNSSFRFSLKSHPLKVSLKLYWNQKQIYQFFILLIWIKCSWFRNANGSFDFTNTILEIS